MKKYILGAVSIVLAISFLAISGEIAIRAYHYLTYTSNQLSFKKFTLDEKFGWLPTSNFVFNGEKIDAGGKNYSVKMQTNDVGSRMFGNPLEKNKKKILFLGDSFTHAMQVSNDKTYYGVLNNSLSGSMEIFAFGVGGYGTLQEYMLLEKYVDLIRPDIIVVQFCSNDYINNYYELELRSNRNNNGMRRPYLTENGITYGLPKSFPVIRDFANRYSRFLYFIIKKIDKLKARHTDSVEDVIDEKGMSYPLFRESVEITEQLVRKIKLRIPSTTLVYAFSSDDDYPYYDEFRRISEENEIYFIDGIPQAVRDAEHKGITTRSADKAHWNETGHQIVANVLENYFEANW